MKNFFLILLLGYYSSFFTLYSQSVPPFNPNIKSIPSSPEAALLGRFGDIPIGYYTGTAEISIPIYTIEEAGVKIPIVLNYHSSGIKVSDDATWVGLGWSLDPGGAIISETRGRYDLEPGLINCSPTEENSFRQKIPLSGDYFSLNQVGRETVSDNCASEFPDSDSYCWITRLVQGGEQPDIYHYNFAGYSGKYYLDDNNQPELIDKKEEIIFEGSNTARTLDGTVFTFGAKETSYLDGYSEVNGHTSKLTQIDLNNGKTINFSYIDEECLSVNYYETSILTGRINEPSGVIGYSHFTNYHKKTLTQIRTPEVVINFNLEDRLDILPADSNSSPVKRLRSIDILSAVSNKRIKTFEFSYGYFNYSQGSIPANFNFDISGQLDAYGKRLKLESVKEIGYDELGNRVETKPSYSFLYDESITLPLKISASKDFWGYYNGQSNNTLLPDLDYFDFPSDDRYKIIDDPFTYNYEGANRYSDTTKAGAYLLQKIIYPTGGYTEFDYESNSFTNQFIPDKNQVNDLYKYNLLQDKNYSTDVVGKTFQLTKSTTITFDNSIYNGYIPNVASGYSYDQMLGAKIDFLKVDMTGGSPVVTTLKKWDLSSVLRTEFETHHGQEWKENIRVDYDPNPNIYYTVNVYLPSDLVNNSYGSVSVMSRFYYFDDSGVETSTSNQCGVRIKSIKNFDEDGKLVSNKRIKYFGGKLLNKFEPLGVSYVNNKTSGGVTGGNFYEYIGFYKRISISSDDFGLSGGNLIGYSRVEEEELAPNNTDNGKTIYYYENTENKTKNGLPNIPNLRNGFLSKKEIYNQLGEKQLEENFYYSSIAPGTFYYGIKIKQMALGPMVPCMNTYEPETNPYITSYYEGSTVSGSKYMYEIYPINSAWYKLNRKITKNFFGSTAVSSTEDYNYNSNGKIKEVDKSDSQGNNLLTTFSYANDYPEGLTTSVSGDMLTHDWTGIPLLIKEVHNGEIISENRVQYDLFDSGWRNIYLPIQKKLRKGGAPSDYDQKINYELYDEFSNPLQVSLENGIPISYIWAYGKTLPIAKIENATYEDIASALGISVSTLKTYTEENLPVINGLRSNDTLSQTMITTYTYDPLVGVKTIIDPKGVVINYTYDSYGRLEFVKDEEGNILTQYEYNYQQ